MNFTSGVERQVILTANNTLVTLQYFAIKGLHCEKSFCFLQMSS
jgi:hypothetical protein